MCIYHFKHFGSLYSPVLCNIQVQICFQHIKCGAGVIYLLLFMQKNRCYIFLGSDVTLVTTGTGFSRASQHCRHPSFITREQQDLSPLGYF